MGRLSAFLLVLLLGAAATVALASCGGSDSSGLLPGATAKEINANLDQVQLLAAEGDCVGAEDAAATVRGQIEGLDGVNQRLKEALSEGATRLDEFVTDCEEVPDEEEAEAAEAAAEAEAEEEKEAEEKKQKAEKPEKKPEKEREQKEPVEPTEPPSEEESVTPPEEEGGGTNSGGVGPATPAGGE